jgi:hypothetical protein
MDANDVQRQMVDRVRLRIGPNMARHILKQLAGGCESFDVIGRDARRGVARRQSVRASDLVPAVTPGVAGMVDPQSCL